MSVYWFVSFSRYLNVVSTPCSCCLPLEVDLKLDLVTLRGYEQPDAARVVGVGRGVVGAVDEAVTTAGHADVATAV